MTLDHLSLSSVTRFLRRLTALLVLVAVVAASCTSSDQPPEPASPTPIESEEGAILGPENAELTVDRGVDLEAGVLQLAVVGDVPADMWAGHLAYWDSVNIDLGGVGGVLQVELIRVSSIRDAISAGALAVSIDLGSENGAVLELLVAESDGSVEVDGRIADLTNTEADLVVSAALGVLGHFAPGELTTTPSFVVTHPAVDCSQSASTVGSSFGVDAIEASPDSPALFVLCVPRSEMLSTAAAALTASPGSTLLIPGTSWAPELASQLGGVAVIVSGYLPEPGVEGAPAADIMSLALGDGPWTGDTIAGYTSALSMHVAIEQSFASGDLTRLGLRQVGGGSLNADLGFGADMVAVGASDGSSETGVRFTTWATLQP